MKLVKSEVTNLLMAAVVAVLMASSFLNFMDMWMLLAWGALLVLLTLLRVGLLIARGSEQKDSKLSIVLTVSSGVTWGASSLLFLPHLDAVHQLLLILVLVGMVAGSSMMHANKPVSFYVFVLPILLPLVFWFFEQGQLIDTVIGCMAVVYMLSLLIHRQHYQNILLEIQQREWGLQQQVEIHLIHEQKLQLHQDILREVAVHHGSLKDVLLRVIEKIEALSPGTMASVLLLDDAGKHLIEGAAPSLPEAWNQLVNGVAIGEGVGSCGTAAFRRERVVVADIASDPLWLPYKDIAIGLGLRACWSQPFIGLGGQVLGTFALYYAQPRSPTKEELASIEYLAQVISIAIDNDKQQRALQRLLQEKQELSEVIEQSTDYIFKVDLQGYVVACNRICNTFFGFDLVGKNLFYLLASDQVRLVKSMIQKKLDDGKPTTYEIKLQDTAGIWRDLEVNSSLRVHEGKTVGINAIARDITVRKRSQSMMELHMSAMNASHEPILILDDLGYIEFANPAAYALYGLSCASMIGHSAALLRKGEVGDALYHEIVDTVSRGETWMGEMVVHSDEGEERVVERRVSPIMDAQGHMHHQVSIDRDITEVKRQQQQMEHTQRLESLGILAGGIAHDFNNILTAIMLNVGVAEKDESSAHTQMCLQRIRQGSERAADLCQQMLAYAGQGNVSMGTLNINAVMHEIMQLVEVSIHKQVKLVFDSSDTLPDIIADKAQIQQVMLNLMTNANEAIGEQEGEIICRTGSRWMDKKQLSGNWTHEDLPEADYVYLAVSDTGCGMDKKMLNKIFEPFYTTKFTGRGLGMSAMLGIIRGHQGVIQIDTAIGKGTTICVSFPVAKNAGDTVVEQSENIHESLTQLPPISAAMPVIKGKVLVVDDEDCIREVACVVLEDIGFECLQASNGEEALQCYAQHADEIVCVLLDMTMPKMDGKACLKALRQRYADVKVLLSSGYHEEELQRIFDEDKPEGFIQKPYLPDALEEKVKSVLS